MLRQIVVPEKNTFILQIPDEMIGKKVEVLAFEIDEATAVDKNKTTAERIIAIERSLDGYRMDLTDFKFNRDEANDYE